MLTPGDDPWPALCPPPDGPVEPRATAPTFSVVVAVHQAEETLAEAIDSALAQTVPPMEVVVCDDGSTDRTPAILDLYAGRVRTVRQDPRGEAAAKNAAVAAAQGEYIVVLDADDVFLPRRIEALGWLARRRPDLDVLVTDAVVEADGVPVRNAYHPGWVFPVADQRAAILERNFVLGLAAVRRERWLQAGGFDESLTRATDWDFWLRLILSGSQVGLVDAPLARYRLAAGTLSSSRISLVEARLTVLRRAAARADLSDTERAVVARALRTQLADLEVRRARAALLGSEPGARRRSRQLLLRRGVPRRARAWAAVGVLSPALASWVLARRERGTVEIGSGLRAPTRGER